MEKWFSDVTKIQDDPVCLAFHSKVIKDVNFKIIDIFI